MDDSGPVTSHAPTASDPPTSGGAALGTAPYMSPEQARGEAVDKRTDIWAFGCVVYEMLSGRRAFGGATTSDAIASLLTAEPEWDALPAHVPPSVRTLLRRCLTRDLSRRLQDIGDARIELEDALQGRSLPNRAVKGGDARSRRLVAVAALGFALLAGALAYRLLTRTTSGGLPAGSRFVIPTSGGARLQEDSYVPFAVSPDGRRLVYVAEDEMFLRPLDEAEARPLPGLGGYDPFFSPDGKWLAFWASGSLKKAPIGGGAVPVVLCEAEDLVGGVWSSDGTIVFASTDRGPLLRVSANGGQPQPATRLLAGELGHLWPELLPGEKALLFTVRTGSGVEDFRIVAQPLDGGERQVLVEGGARARYAASGHLVYARGETLFAARFDLAELRLEGPTVPVLEGVATGPTANAQFAFSPEGSLFYVSAAGPARRSLVLVDRRGVASPLPLDPRPYVFPRISPDGRRLAVQVGDSPRSNLWIYEMETGSFKRLTSGERDTWPCWTPDGKRLAFASGTGTRLRITWQAADGSEPPERLQTRRPTSPALVVPRRTYAALHRDRPVVPADSRRSAREARRPGDPGRGPAWGGRVSPDGRWLTYWSNESGQLELYIRPFDRPGPGRQLTTKGGQQPDVVPGRPRAVLRASRKHRGAPHGHGPRPGHRAAARALRGSRCEVRGFLDFDLLPDGRFVMVRAETAPGAIQVVTGWFDQLRRAVPK